MRWPHLNAKAVKLAVIKITPLVDDNSYSRLWFAVVVHAMRDAGCTAKSAQYERQVAQNYIERDSAFSTICDYAGIDSEYIISLLDTMHDQCKTIPTNKQALKAG